MNNNTPNFDRKPNESEFVWETRVKQQITKHAPKEHRYFVRDGKPGARGQQWILPGVFVLIGLFFAIFSYSIGEEIRNLNGPNGQQGEFTVVDLERRYRDTKNAEDPYDVPVVIIRDTHVIPLLSKDREFAIGEPITVKYTQQGKVVAAFMDEDGQVTNGAAIVGIVMGVIFIGIGLLVGRFYRGAVDPKYVEEEFGRLTNQQNKSDVL